MLYIVPTPIGSLKDITLRALEVLKSVDGIVCEDTRRTSLLLKHYEINKPLLILNDFNEAKEIDHVILKLTEGANIALVSDAGTPLISDPGYKLIRECIAKNIEIDSLPGPSSVITALTLSGLPPDRFLFVGYPPEKTGHRIKWLENLKKIDATIISFVAPHKLIKTLEDMKEVYGDIEITLAKELTKVYQNVESKKISNWLEKLKSPKGEYILLFRL
jgi:16S rRNA (cytidine1402-2'-O)-methyltransferase